MSKIIFTLCSNNYLAHARILGESLRVHAPDCQFYIGLVDEWDVAIDYNSLNAEVIKYDTIGRDFTSMLSRYNIIEFNTAVKPYFIDYFFQRFGKDTMVYYIDPDIKVYHDLGYLHEQLGQFDIILTPNLTVLPSKVERGELASLRHGVFNLGFIGLRYSEETMKFIDWWCIRLESHCKIDKPRGIFVDQKWVDLAPLFFDSIGLLKHQGCNMAWWNFSERNLLQLNGKFYVNNSAQDLIFFHFSGFKPKSTNATVRMNDDSFTLKDEAVLNSLFQSYSEELIENEYDFYSKRTPLLKFYSPPNGMGVNLRRRLGLLKKALVGKV
ncbi:hypothetical protein GCM10007049_00630 [Echinicola pacifica]|uniref:Glycosyl transferase n=1 Tax=Echinicola pacifica TaxID=346377 RepID=A0A918UIJ6_9BACT|nr:hypothetical protein [Echinicola pacifica]GGZ12807.1 hypothetical protein GCM10007049_00630 [Echinicola pacifica]